MIYFADLDKLQISEALKKLKPTDKLVLFYQENAMIPISIHSKLCELKANTEYIQAELDSEKSFYIGAYCGLKKPLNAEFLTDFVIPKEFTKEKSSTQETTKPKRQTKQIKSVTEVNKEIKDHKEEQKIIASENVEEKINKNTKMQTRVALGKGNIEKFKELLSINGAEFTPKWSNEMAYDFIFNAFRDTNGQTKEILKARLLEDFSDNDVLIIMKKIGSNLKKLQKIATE